jgi:hypothetical protein
MELSPSWEAASCAANRDSLWGSQEPSTGPYPKPHQSSPYEHILSKSHFNIIHPPRSMPRIIKTRKSELKNWIHEAVKICIISVSRLGFGIWELILRFSFLLCSDNVIEQSYFYRMGTMKNSKRIYQTGWAVGTSISQLVPSGLKISSRVLPILS